MKKTSHLTAVRRRGSNFFIQMKVLTRSSVIMAAVLLIAAFKTAGDIMEKLAMDQQYARRLILNNLIGRQDHRPVDASAADDDGSPSNSVYNQLKEFTLPRVRTLPALITGDKAGAARELCVYVKEYINSSAFLEDYAKARQSAMPAGEPPGLDAATLENMKKTVKEQEANLVKLKAGKQVPASMIVQMEGGLAELKRIIASGSDPTPNRTQWLKLYPENPKELVRARLEEYLRLSASVDFGARLTDERNRKKFVTPAYEGQSLKWKAVYRAGKEVNSEVTAFVKAWLNEKPLAGGR